MGCADVLPWPSVSGTAVLGGSDGVPGRVYRFESIIYQALVGKDVPTGMAEKFIPGCTRRVFYFLLKP